MMSPLLGQPPARLVAFHGFTQRGVMFQELATLLEVGVLAPDLPGHGGAPPVDTWEQAVRAATTHIETIGPMPLLGYSQGGRLAMGVAVARPDLVDHLILVSASPGIESDMERQARFVRDRTMADRIEAAGTDAFIDEWLASPMFRNLEELDDGWRARDRAMRVSNDAAGLAGALRAYGQGAMPHMAPELVRLECPVTVIVGGRDESYRLVGFAMAQAAGADFHVLGGVGHAVVAEAPYAVADIVRPIVRRP